MIKRGEKKNKERKNIGRVTRNRLTRRSERERMIDRACVRMEERERKREKGCNWSCVRVHGGDPVKMRRNERTRGRVLGAEWNGRYLKNNVQTFDLPQDVCISTTPPPPQRERKRKKKGVPRYPPLSSPCVPSCNHQPPPVIAVMNHGPSRSEYNFLYCVNVRTIRLNKKKNVYITKRQRLDHCVSLTTPRVRTSSRWPRDERGCRPFYERLRGSIRRI